MGSKNTCQLISQSIISSNGAIKQAPRRYVVI